MFSTRRKNDESQVAATVAEFLDKIIEHEGRIADLESRRNAARRRLDELREARNQNILAALAENDGAAQKEIVRLRHAAADEEQGLADLETALAQATQRLASLRTQAAAAQRTALDGRIRALIERRTPIAERLQTLTKQLAEGLEEADKLASEIQTGMVMLGARGPFTISVQSMTSNYHAAYLRTHIKRATQLEIASATYPNIHNLSLVEIEEDVCRSLTAQLDAALEISPVESGPVAVGGQGL